MSTRHLAARERPSSITPFPSQQSRRVVPEPADFDPFDHGRALAERQFCEAMRREGFSPADVDAIAADLMARCDEIITEDLARGAPWEVRP